MDGELEENSYNFDTSDWPSQPSHRDRYVSDRRWTRDHLPVGFASIVNELRKVDPPFMLCPAEPMLNLGTFATLQLTGLPEDRQTIFHRRCQCEAISPPSLQSFRR
jgi:hypothetical protein